MLTWLNPECICSILYLKLWIHLVLSVELASACHVSPLSSSGLYHSSLWPLHHWRPWNCWQLYPLLSIRAVTDKNLSCGGWIWRCDDSSCRLTVCPSWLFCPLLRADVDARRQITRWTCVTSSSLTDRRDQRAWNHMEMWLCGAPYLPGLEHCWYPLCLLMPHICWSPQQTRSLPCFLTFCGLSLSLSLHLQEARAERGHQGETSITGSPSPPPGTRLQVRARQDASLRRLTLSTWLRREERH